MKAAVLFILMFVSVATAQAQTVVTLQPGPEQGKDAMVWDDPLYNKAVRNYAEHEEMLVHAWTDQGVPVFARSYIEFDLSGMTRRQLVSARLVLSNNPDGTFEGQHQPWSGPNRAYLRRVVTPWSEAGLSWNNQPAYTDLHQVLLPASEDAHQSYDIDVTELVRDMLEVYPNRSHGFVLLLEDEQPYRALVFATSDHPDPALRPKLILTFADALNAPAAEVPSPLKLDVYPNPGSVQVDVYAEIPEGGTGHVELLNIVGQVLTSYTIHESTLLHVQLTGIPAGQYWLRLGTQSAVEIKTLIVQ